MSHQYTKATFNTDGECFIVPMTDEEIAHHLALIESMGDMTFQVVASEPLPDDEA
jgi:hypothetical protein